MAQAGQGRDVSEDTQGPDEADRPPRRLTPELRRQLPPFAALRAFEAIGRFGGIRRAAEALSLDHATVSRHLRALEQWSGVHLLGRAPGEAGRLTQDGQLYHGRVAELLAEIASATYELKNRTDAPTLTLWCHPGIASEWLAGRLGEFARIQPEIAINLHSTEAAPSFAIQQADARIFYVSDAEAAAESARCERQAIARVEIARPRSVAVATPEFVAAHGGVEGIEDFLRLPLLHERNTDDWTQWFAAHGLHPDALSGVKLSHAHLTLAAAKRGQGVALSNALLAHDALKRGVLVEVESDRPVHLGSYYFSSHADHRYRHAVKTFFDWLGAQIAAAGA